MSIKISELTSGTTLSGTEELPIVQSGATKKITVQDVADLATSSGATWGSITGTLSAQTDLNTALGDKVDKVTGKGLSANDFTSTLKTKLDGIQDGAEVNVNADWNATSGDAQILNKPTIPSAQVNSDWNATSGVAEILNKPTIPSAVTNTSDLINDGADGVNPFITALDIPTAGQAGTLVREVKNMTGSTLTKGTVVYISGANGNKALVSKARANAESTSARTFGLLQSDILNNGTGYCVVIGDISGLDTSVFTEGAQLYLSGTVAGEYTSTKTLAPTHLVYIGKVTRSHPTQGQIEVQIQNGYELDEIHDCAISSPANNQTLVYESATTLWKNKALTTADITDSTNKRYVTDANLVVIGNTSGTNTGDETKASILSKLEFFYLDFSPSSVVTSTTSEVQVGAVTIPANSIKTVDQLKIFTPIIKVGASGTCTVTYKLSTSATMPTGTTDRIATFTSANNNLWMPMQRNPLYFSGNLVITASSTGLVSDLITSNATPSSIAIDRTQTLYLYVSVQLSNSAEIVYLAGGHVTNM